jgi:hypothetical protein
MVSIFSCVFWPFEFLLLRKFCLVRQLLLTLYLHPSFAHTKKGKDEDSREDCFPQAYHFPSHEEGEGRQKEKNLLLSYIRSSGPPAQLVMEEGTIFLGYDVGVST